MRKKIALTLSLLLSFSITFNCYAETKKDIQVPTIYGKAAITMDLATKEIIYEKDIDKKMYPASTTKLMTALLLAENKKKDDLIKYTETAKKQPAFSLNTNIHPIAVGETMNASDVMDGLLLYSGNDVAFMIAENVSSNSEDFIKMMNEKTEKLNLKNTHFVTPNGLHNPDHYTTAYDLSIIGAESLKNDWVKESFGKKTSTLKSSKGSIFQVENRNKLIGKDGCIGGKTGYTEGAGKCLVAFYERNGRKLVGVVLQSVYDRDDTFVFKDMEKIIDYSYNLTPSILNSKNSEVQTETVSYKPLKFIGPTKTLKVPVIVKEDVTYYNNSINKNEMKKEVKISDTSTKALKGNVPMGTLTLKERNAVKSYKLYSNLPSSTLTKIAIPYYSLGLVSLIAIIALVAFVIKFVNNKRHKRRRMFR